MVEVERRSGENKIRKNGDEVRFKVAVAMEYNVSSTLCNLSLPLPKSPHTKEERV